MSRSRYRVRAFLIGIATGGMLLPAAVNAQSLSDFVISPEAAQRARTRDEISLATAQALVNSCLAFSARNNAPMSVFVLNPGGSVVAAGRADGQMPVQIDTAYMKAQAAIYMRDPTHIWANRVATNPPFGQVLSQLDVYYVRGALPIMVEGVMIGAIGVGGSQLDAECAHTALTEVIGPQPDLDPRLSPTGEPLPSPEFVR
jgi:uncharacterized protein GlcG (DUF336 family)